MDAFEVLRLIRSLKNRLAPINRIPPEVLALIPDSLDTRDGDEDLIALTHVCQAWREIFISRSSLWANFDCTNADKTRVYLERSKSSPINLWLRRSYVLSPSDPFLQIIPNSIDRLKSLFVWGTPKNLQDITAHLSHHAPLLERLDIDGGGSRPGLTTALFNGDLPSLREFRLRRVHTQLPWRNMVNLTSFTWHCMLPDDFPIRHLLDFFESAPQLRNIDLYEATPASGGQDGRLVSLACLKRMDIIWGKPSSLLLSHLLVPVGAKLEILVHSVDRVVEDHLPKSPDNLRNISSITKIRFEVDNNQSCMQLSGPSGRLRITSDLNLDCLPFESLARFDTSKTERLEIVNILDSFGGPPPLENLRILTLSRCKDPHDFMITLRPSSDTSGVMIYPKLEELVFVPHDAIEEFDIETLTKIAAERASRGAKLRTIRIIGGADKLNPGRVLELRKYVPHVEYNHKAGVVSDSDDSDEEY